MTDRIEEDARRQATDDGRQMTDRIEEDAGLPAEALAKAG